MDDAIKRWERIYFAAVGLSALWIGLWGYFVPTVQKSIPFPIPALHARFLGAMYLSAFTLLLFGVLKDRWAEIAIVPLMTATWSGGIFVVSMLHPELFDFSKAQTWVWFVAYAVYPLIALYLVWARRAFLLQTATGLAGGWIPRYLVGQGVLLTALAVALIFNPEGGVEAWPWPITVSLAQLYAAPFMAFGLASLALGRMDERSRMRVGITTLAVFATGVLIASTLHLDLFSFSETADVLWFGSFTVATALLTSLSLRFIRD